jgi:hypothetical protein
MTALDFQATQTADKCMEGGLRAESASAFSCESQALFRQATTATTDTSCNHVPSLTIDCGPGTNIKIPEGLNRDVQIHVNGPSDTNSGGSSHRDNNDRREPSHDRNEPNHRQEDCDRDNPPVKAPHGDYFPSGPGRGGKGPDHNRDREDCDSDRGSRDDQSRNHHGDNRWSDRRDEHNWRHVDSPWHRDESRPKFPGHDNPLHPRDTWTPRNPYDRQPIFRIPEHVFDQPRVQIPEHGDFLARIIAGGLARGFDQSPGQSLSQIKDPLMGISADVPLRFAPSPIPGISTAQLLHDAPSPREALNPLKVAEFTIKEPLKGIKNLLKGKLF